MSDKLEKCACGESKQDIRYFYSKNTPMLICEKDERSACVHGLLDVAQRATLVLCANPKPWGDMWGQHMNKEGTHIIITVPVCRACKHREKRKKEQGK